MRLRNDVLVRHTIRQQIVPPDATLERRGYLGNDLVNFASTLFAALAAVAAQRICFP